MILALIGSPAVGKSEIIKKLFFSHEYTRHGQPPNLIEPKPLFKCTEYHDYLYTGNRVLLLGQYDEGTFSGTDSWSYSVLAKGSFESFIEEQSKLYDKIILDGDRLTSKVEWLTENYDTKVFMLTITPEEEQRRQDDRGNQQNKSWIAGRNSQMANLQNNFFLREHITVMPNNTYEQQNKIITEIIEELYTMKEI
jgi:dephospho-CoA kinase